MFYDSLIKDIAICINVCDTRINRDLEHPSYRGIQRRKQEGAICQSNVSAIGFDTPAQMLPPSALNNIDDMLQEAKRRNLTGCNSRRQISDFIMLHTDLTDCHLCALNEMMSLN
ncbi:MAG: hypothetical protein J6W56_04110 [Prevotella sp.]|nr:hypothetical protein [Prevotella sp.]